MDYQEAFPFSNRIQAPVFQRLNSPAGESLPIRLHTRQIVEKIDALIQSTPMPQGFVLGAAAALGPSIRAMLKDKVLHTQTGRQMPQAARYLRSNFVSHSAFRHSERQSALPAHRETLKDGSPLSARQKLAFDHTELGVRAFDAVATLLRGIDLKETAQPGLVDAMRTHHAFDGLDIEQCWRLFLDEAHQVPDGDYRYENESGYMAGMMNGYSKMLRTVNEPLTAAFLERMHDNCVEGVYRRYRTERSEKLAAELGVNGTELDAFMLKGYRHVSNNSFGLVRGMNCTEKGLAELMDLVDLMDSTGEFTLQTDGKAHVLTTKRCSALHCKNVAYRIIGSYKEAIFTARTTDEKLMAIARCCRNLEANHLFADGNARTIGFCLVNKLLLQNGLPPTVLKDPSIFDGFSVAEAAAEIVHGQKTFARLCGKQLPLTAFRKGDLRLWQTRPLIERDTCKKLSNRLRWKFAQPNNRSRRP